MLHSLEWLVDTWGVNEEAKMRWHSEPLGRLCRAVADDDIAAAEQALIDGADPNVVALRLLHRVAANGSAEMATVLLAYGVDRDRADLDGWTPLTTADACDNAPVAELLVNAGADPAQRQLHGFTELHRAVRRGDRSEIVAALAAVEVDTVDGRSDTALTAAIERRDPDVVELLLSTGADPEGRSPDWSPLTAAVFQDTIEGHSTDFTRRLLEAGADPNPPGVPPIVKAVNQQGRRLDLIDFLLAAGADINAADPRSGVTVLHEAAALYNDPALVSQLLAAGAQVDTRDDRGRTPLHAAADNDHANVAGILLDGGANPRTVDHDGLRPVDLAGTDVTTKIRSVLNRG